MAASVRSRIPVKPQHVTFRDHFLFPEFLRDWGVPFPSRLESRWTAVSGLRMHSRSSPGGDGSPPFVLIHGLVISSLYMIPLAERLAAQFEVHALDLPGCGRSDKPARPLRVPELADAVAAWMEASGILRCHLAGNSFGCQVAADLAARRPDLAASLTLMGPTVDPQAPTLLRQALRLLADMPLEPFRLWLNHLTDDLRAGPRLVLALMRSMIEDRIETKLPRVQAPALVLRGECDPIAPERWVREAAALLPRGAVAVVPRGSHCAHYAAPDSVAETMISFVRNGHAKT